MLKTNSQPLTGINFTKNDIKKRLRKMNIQFDEVIPAKNYYVKLYDNALKDEANIKLIQDDINNDFELVRKKEKRVFLADDEESTEDKSSSEQTTRKITVIHIHHKKNLSIIEEDKRPMITPTIKTNIFPLIYTTTENNKEKKKEMKNVELGRSEFSLSEEKKKETHSSVEDNSKEKRISMGNIMPRDMKEELQCEKKHLYESLLNGKVHSESVKECDTASSLKFTRIPKSPLKLTEPLSEVKSQQKEDKEDDTECIYLSPNISQISINTSQEKSSRLLYYTMLSSGIGLTSIGALCYYMMKRNISMRGIIEKINLKEIAIGVFKEAQELLSRVNLSNGSIIAILGGVVIIGVISYMLYKTEKENRMIRSLYSEIKEELRTAKKTNDGLTEEEIIRRISVKNGLTEEKFKIRFLPKLKTLRKKDLSVEEYESEVDGRRILKWQIM